MGLRRALIGMVVVLSTALGGGSWLLLGNGGSAAARSGVHAARTAELPPLPTPHPMVVEPVAGQTDAVAVADAPDARCRHRQGRAHAQAEGRRLRHPAPRRRPAAVRGGISKATALPNGVALQPLQAPAAVLKIIEAGNAIARTPYKWGGGHGRWQDTGYDCSGSVSFALYFAGLLEGPRDSSGLMSWGKAGPGKWVTVYASPGHVYMEVAGVRFDTSGAQATGSRWQNDLRGRRPGFVARHPAGL